MTSREKPIRFSGHARQQLHYRGATEEEVVEAIRGGNWSAAERGRLECRMEFPFGSVWNGRFYEVKQVRPVFVNEPEGVVVVTVYVYYFSREAQ